MTTNLTETGVIKFKPSFDEELGFKDTLLVKTRKVIHKNISQDLNTSLPSASLIIRNALESQYRNLMKYKRSRPLTFTEKIYLSQVALGATLAIKKDVFRKKQFREMVEGFKSKVGKVAVKVVSKFKKKQLTIE